MKNARKAHSKENAPAPRIPQRFRGRSRFRTGAAVLACTAALALSSCSAGQAENKTESAESPKTSMPAASPSTSVTAGESNLQEPLAPQIDLDGVSPSGVRVLSEQGTGTGTYRVEGGLEAGQVLSLSASCTPGDSVRIHGATGSYGVACTSPGSSLFFDAPAGEPVSDLEVTVETANGSPYWLAGWVHDAQ